MVSISGNGKFHPPEEGKENDPEKDFPLEDTYTDCAGTERIFTVDYEEVGLGFLVTAEERGKNGQGYAFSAFDPNSPYLALGKVREKIYRGLATRYLKHNQLSTTHDEVKGRIGWNADEEAACFVIDGRLITLEEFGQLVSSHEGWEFEFRFRDPSE